MAAEQTAEETLGAEDAEIAGQPTLLKALTDDAYGTTEGFIQGAFSPYTPQSVREMVVGDVRRTNPQAIADYFRSEYMDPESFGNRKPRLRGWLHLITLPLCIAASIVLICIAPAGPVKAACAVYGASAMLLFGNSALLHVVPWRSAKVTRVLCGIDYSNIFLIVAGTNTPVLFALSPAIRRPYLTVIWATAAIGTILHIVWLRTPNWVFTTVYVVLGLAPVTLIPQLWTAPAVGPAATILIACGGAAYIAGAVCFALHKPNPIPGWFEFHEMFHLGTVIGYTCHVVAIYLIVCAL